MMQKVLMTLSNVSFIASSQKSILQDICYTVYEGDFVVILGSNGSGKSSLLKLINKTYATQKGEILCAPHFDVSKIMTLMQDVSDNLFSDFTVLENCLIYESLINPRYMRIGSKKERSFYSDYLSRFLSNFSDKLDNLVTSLSGGQRQALALALALRHHPPLLLLDEHTSALDPKTAHSLMELTSREIGQQKITSLMTTHNIEHALFYGNRLIALNEGRIVFSIDGEEKKKLTKNDILAYCYER
jgi:putative tryptophan/tyrosine transport system ATP-binding protein